MLTLRANGLSAFENGLLYFHLSNKKNQVHLSSLLSNSDSAEAAVKWLGLGSRRQRGEGGRKVRLQKDNKMFVFERGEEGGAGEREGHC